MAPCKKHSDCMPCGRHPLTDQHYRCQRRYVLYDTVYTDNSSNLIFLNETSGSASAFDIDLETGAATGKTGICVDIDSSYNEGCASKIGAMVKDGLVGCMDGFTSKFLCGLSVEVLHGDLSTVQTSGNLFYEGGGRLLLGGASDRDGDGQNSPELRCTDPIDCTQKCLLLERTARDGAGAPQSCALCDQYCSSNAVSTIMDLKEALWFDVVTVVHLMAKCFGHLGLAGCICQLSMTLQPSWRAHSTNDKVRCTNGDPWEMLLAQLDSQIVEWAEWGLNQFINTFNNIMDAVPLPIPDIPPICWNTKVNPDKCPRNATRLEHFRECENPTGGVDLTCYYHRVSTICTNANMLMGYNGLFAKGFQNLSNIQAEYEREFGDSYDMFDPQLLQVMEEAHASSLPSNPDFTQRRAICSSSAFYSAMRLDQIIVSCLFAMVEKACPESYEDDENFAFTIQSTTFKLPLVRWTYDVAPPPPPPLIERAYQALVDDDPQIFIEVRRKLENWFPKLSHVATSSLGAGIGPYVAEYTVTPQQLTRAYLASHGMVPDSLGARVVESKHTGRWRYACKMMHEYFAQQTSPGSFSQAVKFGIEEQRDQHSGKWDRNPMMAAMMEIRMSMTGHPLDQTVYDTLKLWGRVCGGVAPHRINTDTNTGGGPAGYRVPTNKWYDPDLDTQNTHPRSKAFLEGMGSGYEPEYVDITDFSPIVGYGSLELLRSQKMIIMHSCSQSEIGKEDAALSLYCDSNERIMNVELLTRQESSPFAIQRNLWCDPHKRVTIEETYGNPDYFESDLTDTELKEDYSIDNLRTEATLRGEEDITGGGESMSWTRRSLRSWVYVTSSADKDIRAGMYRIADLPLFRAMSCGDVPYAQCSNQFIEVERTATSGNFYSRIPEFTSFAVRGGANDDLAQPPGDGESFDWRVGLDAATQAQVNHVKNMQLSDVDWDRIPARTKEYLIERSGSDDFDNDNFRSHYALLLHEQGARGGFHPNAALNFMNIGGAGGASPDTSQYSAEVAAQLAQRKNDAGIRNFRFGRRELFDLSTLFQPLGIIGNTLAPGLTDPESRVVSQDNPGGLFANLAALPPELKDMMGINIPSLDVSGAHLNSQAPPVVEKQYKKRYVNTRVQLYDGLGPRSTEWRTGREAVLSHRCNAMLAHYLSTNSEGMEDPCVHTPYISFGDHNYGDSDTKCIVTDLVMESDPQAYGADYYLNRFLPYPSPSPPPPPPTSPPPPSPPSPLLPPGPPVRESQADVMAYIRDAEKQACTTVYYLSQTTRCERLAIALTQPYLIQFTDPPAPPPIGDGTSPSPPPSLPPSPSLPSEFEMATPTQFRLSTMRYPLVISENQALEQDGFYVDNTPDALTNLESRLYWDDASERACQPMQTLACASGLVVDRCVNAARRCGTAEENGRDPFVEFEFQLTRDSYLWGMRFALPRRPELAGLAVGARRVELWGPRNVPIPCFEGAAVVHAVPTEHYIDVICAAPTAAEDALRALATVWRARLTLTGEYRQVWLSHERPVQLIERPLSAAEVEVLALPPSPMQPPTAAPPALDDVCDFGNWRWFDDGVERRVHEPCGMSKDACCAAKNKQGAGAYEIDDAKCCTLLFFVHQSPNLTLPSRTLDPRRMGRWTTRSGTGV